MTSPAIRGAGRPEDGYRLNGERIPGATTITGRGKDKQPLVKWAYNRGRDGLALYGSRDAAAEAGTIAHQWIEDAIHGDPLTAFPDADDDRLAEAMTGYRAFLKWQERVRLRVVETEVPLVSAEYRYGGTLDALAVVGGELVLFDWKTSNATYQDYIAQVAAYRQLVRERDGDAAPREAYLLRVGKEFGDFHEHYWPEHVLDLGWRWFLAALDLYRLDGRLRKVAA